MSRALLYFSQALVLSTAGRAGWRCAGAARDAAAGCSCAVAGGECGGVCGGDGVGVCCGCGGGVGPVLGQAVKKIAFDVISTKPTGDANEQAGLGATHDG